MTLGGADTTTLLTVNDMHIVTMDDSVQDAYVSTVQQRRDALFISDVGKHSIQTWDGISAILDSYQADGIVFIGDMIDYSCEKNASILKAGLAKIQTPYTYLRADHDLGVWYTDGAMTSDEAKAISSGTATWQDVFVVDYGNFYLLGWNNSTSQLSEEGLAAATELLTRAKNEGKAVILATHVPLNSTIDSGLEEAARAADGEGRAKLWGENCLYQPNEVTGEFLEEVLAEDSPVVAVLSGHLHFKYTTQLTEKITEYVMDTGFRGKIGVIKVK